MDQIKIENLEIFDQYRKTYQCRCIRKKTDWDRSFWFPVFYM